MACVALAQGLVYHKCSINVVLSSDSPTLGSRRESYPDQTFWSPSVSHVQGIPLTPIFTDTVVFRIAPWIMTPNILPPVSVFVCW